MGILQQNLQRNLIQIRMQLCADRLGQRLPKIRKCFASRPHIIEIHGKYIGIPIFIQYNASERVVFCFIYTLGQQFSGLFYVSVFSVFYFIGFADAIYCDILKQLFECLPICMSMSQKIRKVCMLDKMQYLLKVVPLMSVDYSTR